MNPRSNYIFKMDQFKTSKEMVKPKMTPKRKGNKNSCKSVMWLVDVIKKKKNNRERENQRNRNDKKKLIDLEPHRIWQGQLWFRARLNFFQGTKKFFVCFNYGGWDGTGSRDIHLILGSLWVWHFFFLYNLFFL